MPKTKKIPKRELTKKEKVQEKHFHELLPYWQLLTRVNQARNLTTSMVYWCGDKEHTPTHIQDITDTELRLLKKDAVKLWDVACELEWDISRLESRRKE